MKPKLFIFLLLLFLNSYIVFSQPLDIVRDTYVAGETLQANVDIEGFQKTGLSLEDSLNNSLSIAFRTFQKTENHYHVYFDIPTDFEEDTYTLKYANYSDSFIITNGTSAIAINPPIIKLFPTKTSFKIALTNKGSVSTDVQVSPTNPLIKPARSSITVPIDESVNLFVNYNTLPATTSQLTLSYNGRGYSIDLVVDEIPVTAENITINQTEAPQIIEGGLELLDPAPIEHSITSEQTIEGPLEFKSTLPITIYNVTFHLTPRLADIMDFNITTFPEIESEKVYSQYLWINRNKNAAAGNYSGTLLIKSSEGYSTTLYFGIIISDVVEEPVEQPIEPDETTEEDTGFEVSEIPVDDNESGAIFVLPEDSGTEEDKSKNMTIGLILLAIILIIGGFIAWRLRPKKKVIKFGNYLQSIRKKEN